MKKKKMNKCTHDGTIIIIEHYDAEKVLKIKANGFSSGFYNDDIYEGRPNKIDVTCEDCKKKWTVKLISKLPEHIKERYYERDIE